MTALAFEVARKAGKLSALDRERLAARLISGLDNVGLSAVDEAWIAVAERRLAAWKRRKTKARPAMEVLARIRKELGCGTPS